jgi:hypothetical protein
MMYDFSKIMGKRGADFNRLETELYFKANRILLLVTKIGEAEPVCRNTTHWLTRERQSRVDAIQSMQLSLEDERATVLSENESLLDAEKHVIQFLDSKSLLLKEICDRFSRDAIQRLDETYEDMETILDGMKESGEEDDRQVKSHTIFKVMISDDRSTSQA